jgi:hypothetical protein
LFPDLEPCVRCHAKEDSVLTISKASHLDHGLSTAHIEWLTRALNERIAAGEAPGVSVHTFTIPSSLPGLHTALLRTAEGVRVEPRGSREWPSRVVDRPMRWTRQCTAVVGPHEVEEHVLFTAYGGPAAPREPGDPSLTADADKAESEAFWAHHALAVGGPPGIPESEAPNDDPGVALGHD